MAILSPAKLAASGSEHGHQRAYFAALLAWSRIVWEHTFAIPNGRKRDIRDAAALKAEGVKPGAPDVLCAYPFGVYHGLFIEMKKPEKGVIANKQNEWHDRLIARGYAVAVCYSWDEALAATQYYFNCLPPTHCIAQRFIRQEPKP